MGHVLCFPIALSSLVRLVGEKCESLPSSEGSLGGRSDPAEIEGAMAANVAF